MTRSGQGAYLITRGQRRGRVRRGQSHPSTREPLMRQSRHFAPARRGRRPRERNLTRMKPERTWKDVVCDALRQHGGEATLKEITEFALQAPKAKTNTTVREKVRQVVRAYSIFETP